MKAMAEPGKARDIFQKAKIFVEGVSRLFNQKAWEKSEHGQGQ